ncbi:MAG: glycosyltransferase family 39 protein [Endomicrobiales bacterium]|nr:glycosyltransferase family 39 protein [Endomicrobiales bacterium]
MKKNVKNKPLQKEYPVNILPSGILYVLLAVWFYVVTANYMKVYPANIDNIFGFYSVPVTSAVFSNILGYFFSIIFVISFFVSSFGIGKLVAGLFKLEYLEKDDVFYVLGIGLAAIIYFLLLVGSLGYLYNFIVLIVLSIGLIFGLKNIYGNKPGIFISFEKTSMLLKILVLLTVFQLFYVFLGALSYETFYDSLKYHLTVPQYWLNHHKISSITNFEYSYYPVNIHIVYLVGLMFGSDITAKLLHFSFGILSAFAVYRWSRKYFSNAMGLLAVVILFAVPFVSMVMWKTAIEMGLAFFETLAALSLIRYITEEAQKKSFWLILSAIFCGVAIGGKYLSIFSLISIVFVILVYSIINKTGIKKAVLSACFIGIISIVLVLPYLIRNYFATGVPTYPYGVNFNKGITTIVKDDPIQFRDPAKPDRSIKNFLTLPWNMTMGKKTQEPLSGAVWLLCLPLPFLFKKIDTKIRLLLWYSLIYYLCWFSVRTYFRYIIPLMPVTGIIFAYFITETRINSFVKGIIYIFFGLICLSNITLISVTEFMTMDPLRVVLGNISKKEYLSINRQSYPSPYFQVVDWANKNLPMDAKVLFMGECRGYHIQRKFVTHTTSDHNPLVLLLNESKDEEELCKNIKREGITHILLNVPEAKRLSAYDIMSFEPDDLEILDRFWKKYIVQIYNEAGDISAFHREKGLYSIRKLKPEAWENYAGNPYNNVYLYKILSEEEAKETHIIPKNFFLDGYIYNSERWKRIKSLVEKI